jgi:hypothetical protein
VHEEDELLLGEVVREAWAQAVPVATKRSNRINAILARFITLFVLLIIFDIKSMNGLWCECPPSFRVLSKRWIDVTKENNHSGK